MLIINKCTINTFSFQFKVKDQSWIVPLDFKSPAFLQKQNFFYSNNWLNDRSHTHPSLLLNWVSRNHFNPTLRVITKIKLFDKMLNCSAGENHIFILILLCLTIFSFKDHNFVSTLLLAGSTILYLTALNAFIRGCLL